MNRENSSETIGEVVVERGLSSASVQQFALEGRGHGLMTLVICTQPSGSWHNRVAEAIKILKQEEVKTGDGQRVIVPEIPRFLAIYADDLTQLPNLGSAGFSLALTMRHGRRDSLETRIYGFRLGLLVDALGELGILIKLQ